MEGEGPAGYSMHRKVIQDAQADSAQGKEGTCKDGIGKRGAWCPVLLECRTEAARGADEGAGGGNSCARRGKRTKRVKNVRAGKHSMRALYLKPRARRGKDMLSRTTWTQHGAGSSGGSALGVHLRLRQDMHNLK